jgi:GNAT superfamily N-acetyltransferase
LRTIVEVRRARPGDAEPIAELMDQLGYSVPASAISERLQRLGERRDVFVATDDGRVVGWAALFVDEPFVEGFGAFLEGLVVDEAVRSRGIGIALLEAVEARARERGCAQIRVQSNVLRERAHSFYERNGYAKVKAQYQLRKTLSR